MKALSFKENLSLIDGLSLWKISLHKAIVTLYNGNIRKKEYNFLLIAQSNNKIAILFILLPVLWCTLWWASWVNTEKSKAHAMPYAM